MRTIKVKINCTDKTCGNCNVRQPGIKSMCVLPIDDSVNAFCRLFGKNLIGVEGGKRHDSERSIECIQSGVRYRQRDNDP